MEDLSLHEKLSDYKSDFVKKLRIASKEGKLDIWIDRKDKPNLSRPEFLRVLKKLKKGTMVKWVARKSEEGPYGLTGEDECFIIEEEVNLMGNKKIYFIKGYFFNKGDLQGVCIQSFRKVHSLKIVK